MSSEVHVLPAGWVKTKLADVSDIAMGQSPVASTINSDNKGLPFYQGKTEFTDVYPLKNRYCEEPIRIAEAENILMSVRAPVGPVNIARERSGFGRGICAIACSIGLNHKFVFYQLKCIEDYVASLGTGTTFMAINRGSVESLPIHLAPENEQNRIVEKLEELFSDLDNGVAELKACQKKLTQYRQALLKSAVEGTLTKQWREQNQSNITETGEQLLARILTERRQRWEQQKLAEFKEKGVKPPKDWQKNYAEPVKPNTSELWELPEGWVWATIDQLAINKRYGSSSKTNDDTKGIPVLRMGNIQDGEIDYTSLKYLPRDHYEFPDLLLTDGELLFNRTNSAELVGKTAIYRDVGKPCSYASYLIAVKFIEYYKPELAAYFINSVLGKAWLETVMNQTAGQANVNGTKLGELAIPVPPLIEQAEIIKRMISAREQTQTQLFNVELGIKQSEAQRKNILKDAFSGKLVEQDPSDEPASILLEKIQAERAARANTPKLNRAKKKASTKADIMDTLLDILKIQDDWMDAQDAFKACGVTDGTDTDRIEELYAELRKLDKEGLLSVKRHNHYDFLKLKSN